MSFPLPGKVTEYGTVIASVYYREANDAYDGPEIDVDEFAVVLLRDRAPYYQVAVLADNVFDEYEMIDNSDDFCWQHFLALYPFWNIVPAIKEYEDWGGDI